MGPYPGAHAAVFTGACGRQCMSAGKTAPGDMSNGPGGRIFSSQLASVTALLAMNPDIFAACPPAPSTLSAANDQLLYGSCD